VLAEYQNDVYKVVLVLHILCAIVGFGAVMLNGVYAAQARSRQGKEGLAISEANMFVSRIAEFFILAVLVFGIALVPMGDPVTDFGQTWIWLAIVLFAIAVAISNLLLVPRVSRLIALQHEIVDGPPPSGGPPPQVAEMERIGKQVPMFAITLQVLLVAVLSLMVFKPGFT
jgi:uncharacterized membrane protein